MDSVRTLKVFFWNSLVRIEGDLLEDQLRKFGKKTVRDFTFIICVVGNITETFLGIPSHQGCHWSLLYVDTVTTAIVNSNSFIRKPTFANKLNKTSTEANPDSRISGVYSGYQEYDTSSSPRESDRNKRPMRSQTELTV